MRLNRGCGCVLLVLAGLNLVFIIGAVYGMTAGDTSVGLGLLALAVFGANCVASLLLGIAGYRGLPISARGPVEETSEVAGEREEEDEGWEEEPDEK